MDNMFVWFNNNLGGPIGSIIAAILIFVIGWLIAMALGGVVRNLLARVNLNQRMNSSTGRTYDIEGIVAKVIFWFIFLMAISGALSVLSLDAISTPFSNMISSVLTFIPTLAGAVVTGVIGWVVATVARSAINTALSKTTLDEKLSEEAGVQPMSSTIADMVYWVILLFILVIVLGQLQLDGLFAPLTAMLHKAVGFIPNIFLAGLVFFVGYIVGKIVRGIVTNMVASLNLQSFAEKAGISNKRENSLPNLAGSLAFLLIIIPTTIVALDVLNIEVISRPAMNMLNKILDAVPNIITAAAVLIITYFIIRIVANTVKSLLENTNINALPAKVGLDSIMGNTQVSDLVSYVIVFFAMLFASIAAADLLGFEQISNIVTMFIAFGADIILGAIILFIGFWLANLIAGAIERSDKGTQFLANIVRILIMGLVLAMGLRAMGIADSIVNLAFGLTLGAVAVAFAISFGLGGQEAAARFLRKLQDKAEAEAEKKKVAKSVADTAEQTGKEPSITTVSGDEPTLPGSEDQ
ncbi:mechanosensitive ion channel [Psychrobacter lutiphocae]|uniref:mechanosensitive ion channel n=1 Tax=Psychrobacter lutiphocae TaxID=540500 RepID=UPI0003720341|nr:mechanosensitive ion channel [Psychrobacter lutiphocae]